MLLFIKSWDDAGKEKFESMIGSFIASVRVEGVGLDGRLDTIVNGITISNRTAKSTPLELFTHVITHEFHHKGQILSMFRLLGHKPPDADVIRF